MQPAHSVFLKVRHFPEDLIQRAAELNMPAMALLDRNGVYGAARFHTLAHKHGVRAHVGAEIAVSDLGKRLTPPAWLPYQHVPEPVRLPLLCTSRAGYQNLCQLITRFKMRETTKCEGAATLKDLEQYSSGLVCLTGGDEGPLAAALMHGGEPEAVKVTEKLVRVFGQQNVYIELQRHGEREEEWRNQAAIRIAHAPALAAAGYQRRSLCNCVRPGNPRCFYRDTPPYQPGTSRPSAQCQSATPSARSTERWRDRFSDFPAGHREHPGLV